MVDAPVRSLRPALTEARTIGCYLGSFDPPHRGHVALIRALHASCDGVLVLIPTTHFHKSPRYPDNATFGQRLAMVDALPVPRSVQAGLTDVVLFLALDARLARELPGVRVVYGMGDETYRRVVGSRDYYLRCGLPWGAEQQQRLADLEQRCRVWNRSGHWPAGIPCSTSGISSTLVRQCVSELWRSGADTATWERILDPLVPPPVAASIRRFGLYRCVSSLGRSPRP